MKREQISSVCPDNLANIFSWRKTSHKDSYVNVNMAAQVNTPKVHVYVNEE